jgi:hypothetical protein
MTAALRLTLLTMAIALGALFWHQQQGKAMPQTASWSGVTSQGEAISASSFHGLLTGLDTHVTERCTDGSSFRLHWQPAERRFVQHGDDVQALQTGAGQSDKAEPDAYDTRVWAHMGVHPSGTISAQDIVTRAGGGVLCRSGAVTFQLERSL